MPVLAEKSYAEYIINNGTYKKLNEIQDAYLLARYYYDKYQSYELTKQSVDAFCNRQSYLYTSDKVSIIHSIIDKNIYNSKINSPNDIIIYDNEITSILKLNSVNLQQLMFSILILIKVQNDKNEIIINNLEKEIELANHNQDKLITKLNKMKLYKNSCFDDSKNQRDLFEISDLMYLPKGQRQLLLRELKLMGYIDIKTIRYDIKLIIINDEKIDVNNGSIVFKINDSLCSKLDNNNVYSFNDINKIWFSNVLNLKIKYCLLCGTRLNIKSNVQKYCTNCAKLAEKKRKRNHKNKK